MDPGDLLARVAAVLEELELPFFVTGSTATIAYGEPRFTNDIDIVLRLTGDDVALLAAAFDPQSFYLSEESMKNAVGRHASFNLIHPGSGLKVDFMVAGDSEFDRSRFARVRQIDIGADRAVPFASPEDVIVKKLEWFREGGSEKHLRDIGGVLRTSEGLDLDYIEAWAERLGLTEQWVRAQALR